MPDRPSRAPWKVLLLTPVLFAAGFGLAQATQPKPAAPVSAAADVETQAAPSATVQTVGALRSIPDLPKPARKKRRPAATTRATAPSTTAAAPAPVQQSAPVQRQSAPAPTRKPSGGGSGGGSRKTVTIISEPE